MNVQNMLKYTADLSHGVTLTPLRMAFVRGEAQAHMFIITAYENHQKVDLTGAVVNGYMMRSDQTTLTFDGSVSGGNAVISLPGAAYSVTGRFRLVIQATVDGMTTTLFYGEGAVSPSATDVIAIPEEILMPSLENIEAQVEEMVAATAAAKAAAQGAVVRNLLDNSDFRNPINQRNATSTTAWCYCLDRWLARNSGMTLSADSSGLKITTTDTANNYIYQKINAGKALNGKTVTVAVCDGNGEIAVKTVTLPTTNTSSWYGYGNAITSNNVYVNVTDVGNGGDYPLVVCAGIVSNAASGTVKWVALYEGAYTAETLPGYQPKGYAAELAECQRYYYRISGDNARMVCGIFNDATNAVFPVHFPVVMRIAPTLTHGNIGVYFDGKVTAANALTILRTFNVGVVLHATVNGGTTGKACMIASPDWTTGVLEFSADL